MGASQDWDSISPHDWTSRLQALAGEAGAHGVRRVTVVPFSGTNPDSSAQTVRVGSVTLVADRSRDGRARIVEAVGQFGRGTQVTERMLSAALVGDAGEPDLVVVAGNGAELPPNLVWELAYAEIVFIDVDFDSFSPGHVGHAISEFGRRSRRFGGVDE